MKISKRLETIASLIPSNSKVIDIGCDHALLDIYLAHEKNCECIASDINNNALDQARYNVLRFQVKTVTLMLTDGLDNIPIHDEDIIVISGMGTSTIEHILEGKKLSRRLIISSHTDFEDLRRYVVSLGYRIEDEKYIEEKKKAYIIMSFVKGDVSYTDEDYRYGPILKKNVCYIENEREKVLEIINQLPKGNDEMKRRTKILEELDKLRNNA